jgi:hypothetical protein
MTVINQNNEYKQGEVDQIGKNGLKRVGKNSGKWGGFRKNCNYYNGVISKGS